MSHPGAPKVETEEREERGSGRSQNVVHTLSRSMASVPGFLTGPLERLDPAAGGTQVVVITPDPETAVALAEAVLRLTGPAGIELLPVTSARRAGRLMAGRPVLAVAGSPRDIRDLVRGSHLKLDAVRTVVLAWADEVLAGEAEDIEALEAVMSEIPKDAARIVVTSRNEGRVNAFAERYLRRAHREVPQEDAGPAIPIQYVTVSPTSRATALRRLLDDMDPPSAAILVTNDESEETVGRTLRLLGYSSGGAAVRVTRGDVEPATYAVIFFDTPASRAALAAAASASPVTIVALAEPREVPGLRTMSGEIKPFTLSAPGTTARDRDSAMRRELTSILDSGVALREVLALEPLLDRHDGIEIAAAALRLLERERSLRKAAQEETRAQRDTADRASADRSGFDRAQPARPARGNDRGAPQRDRGPSTGGTREGGRTFSRGNNDRPRQEPGSGREDRPFREARGPRESRGPGASRGARDRHGGGDRRPARDGHSRPPRRDRS
ncbi:MAG TPA: hypothetical protein VHM24_05330 [Gemmatimonadaceae bacterium]|nr:hypothetical protein [Gemmatimonadaceae bacterium]